MRLFNKRGQSVAEYSILLALVIAVAFGMQAYIKRGIQGRVRDSSDDYVKEVAGAAEWSQITSTEAPVVNQYEPEEFERQATSDVTEDTTKYDMTAEGAVIRDITKTTQGEAGDYQKSTYDGP